MQGSIIKNGKMKNFALPRQVFGNYWIKDLLNNSEDNLINVVAQDNHWVLLSNYEVAIMEQGMPITNIVLEEYHFYTLQNLSTHETLELYMAPLLDPTNHFYHIDEAIDITIGSGNQDMIMYANEGVKTTHAKITYQNGSYFLSNNHHDSLVYLNHNAVEDVMALHSGDIIFLKGLKVIFVVMKKGILLNVNSPLNKVVCHSPLVMESAREYIESPNENEELPELELYQDSSYFHKKPRFRALLTELKMVIDPPPIKANEDDRPLLLIVGPMVTMGMSSAMMGLVAVNNVVNNNAKLISVLPSIVMCVAMMSSVILWPIITNRFDKKKQKKLEAKRQKKYKEYIEEKRQVIIDTIRQQRHILLENNLSLEECKQVILHQKFNLWERKKEEQDFLTVSLGMGTIPMKISIDYPTEHFTLEEDNLREMLNSLGREPKNLADVPITLSLIEQYIVAIIGNKQINQRLVNNMILQLVAFHSYDDLKIVVFTNECQKEEWSFTKFLPHSFRDDKKMRFFASNNDDSKEICYFLEHELSRRMEDGKTSPYYLLIIDDFKSIRHFDLINHILESKQNMGFSMIIMNDNVSTLPTSCQMFIHANSKNSDLFKNVLNADTTKFQIDFTTNLQLEECARVLANIPLDITENEEGKLPNKLSFLNMYQIGMVEQLNAPSRWQKNNPIQSLQAPIGVGKNQELIRLDLHEKYAGPHGLVAGMTGSGKSELLITYILSMAVNYHPEEVQFILIDYKGGGLSGSLENHLTGERLPHLVGTITNLDAVEIKRSFASIDSELKRRQRMFNEARAKSKENTIDIYKYQQLYRKKVVNEAISHLFIITDEFAELKTQQPEFMQQLIQTARIGRSLGVHLILATQKPSGVVDNQIWSNTRFRVCLRVQEKSDSTEVIKSPEAALLTQTGRFYLQVGYNEIFVLGQAAWCGATYLPVDKPRKEVDTKIEFINDIGVIYHEVDIDHKSEKIVAHGEELSNIVTYLIQVAKSMNIKVRPLWLEKLPSYIAVQGLMQKYSYQKVKHILNPIVGEYDMPNKQSQSLLTIPFSENGNAIVYGMTGSGKENFLTTLFYSLITTYTTDEVNIYLLDFGSETLKSFENAPHVGDIITVTEEEKMANFYKMMDEMIETRKQLFAPFNGTMQGFLQQSDKLLPQIVVVINNYEGYQETFNKYEDVFFQLTREAPKYGIYFVLTINNLNGIRFKVRQNFAMEYVLQQTNVMDYNNILGNVQKMYPSKTLGRGLVNLGEIYEFQTAFVAPLDQIPDYIRKVTSYLREKFPKAKGIPVLPKRIETKHVLPYLTSGIPILGMEKDTLKPLGYDFTKQYVNLILGQDILEFSHFYLALINELAYLKKEQVIVINAEEMAGFKADDGYFYYDREFDVVFTWLRNTIDEAFVAYQNQNREFLANRKKVICTIIGFDAFRSKLNEENRNLLASILEKGKFLGIINFIIVANVEKAKRLELESWYKNVVNPNYGIYLGNGLGDQFTLKINKVTKEHREELPPYFGFVVVRSRPVQVKFIEEFAQESVNVSKNESVSTTVEEVL